jgi:uncharacterized protein
MKYISKFFSLSIVRIIVGFIFFSAIAIIADLIVKSAYSAGLVNLSVIRFLRYSITIVLWPVSYWLYFRWAEKRRCTEISLHRFGINALGGFILGFLCQAAVIGIIFIAGGYEVVAVHWDLFWILIILGNLATALSEEFVFRGILFRVVEEKLGSIIALVISALIFGLLHLMNQNSSFTDGIAVAIEAGLSIAALYMYSRNIWLPVFFHMAWNMAEGDIFGVAVSGGAGSNSLLEANISGAKWLTGGEFGPEGSLVAVVICSIITAVFLILCWKQGKFVKGSVWTKK